MHIPRACECAVRFLSMAGDRERFTEHLGYAAGPSKKGEQPTLHPLEPGKTLPEGWLKVLPCQEAFLHADSKGTEFYKQNLGRKTKFQGCHKLEEALLNAKEIAYDVREIHGKQNDILFELELADYGLEVSSEGWEELVSGFRAYSGKNRIELLELTDFQEKLLKNQSSEIHTETQAGLEELIEEYEQKESRQREVGKRVRKFLKTLTPAQRKVIEEIYLKNYGDLSQAAVAEKLGISLATLKDRLTLSKKKLRKEFSELVRRETPSFTEPETERPKVAPVLHTDSDGVKRLVPASIFPAVAKQDVDRAALKAALDREFAPKIAFAMDAVVRRGGIVNVMTYGHDENS